ncbi:MAG: HEAT repeat domain-containing protein, partial [Gemmatimonadaceae bacterium]
DQAAAAGLLTLLRDSSPTVRASAAWALGELEHKAAINPLAELLERDQSARVRRAAARALGQIAG